MPLDPFTLTTLLGAQLALMALALPAITGWRTSLGVRLGVASIWMQLLGVIALTLGPGALLGHIGFVLVSLTYPLALHAFQHWLGPRPLARWAWLPSLAIALLLLLGHGERFTASILTHVALALAQAHLALALLWPSADGSAPAQRWRYLLALPAALLALLSAARAVVGLDSTQAFPSLTTLHPLALGTLLVGNLVTILASLSVLAAWRGEAETQLRQAAQTDPLTGLANRRELERCCTALIQAARRHGDNLLALLIDIDHFKQINDVHGHAQGDAALRLLAEQLKALQRPGDCAARIGGEEFVLLLARSSAEGAVAFDRRLREALRDNAPRELGFALDYSAGWALLRPGDRHVHDMLARADAALYRAKAKGRGRLCAEPGFEDCDEHDDAAD